jgi:SAM-dependent methyltransferase
MPDSVRSRCYPESRFGGFTDIDGTLVFYRRVQALLTADAVALDIGCGRGQYMDDPIAVRRDARILRGKCRRVIGLDVDAAAQSNPFIDEFALLDGPRWPVADASIDLALADFVLEHVADPDRFFDELARVLRPGGVACLRTPNAWGYVAVCSRLIPNRFHASVLAKTQDRRKAEDVFPTFYRCNRAGKMRRQFARHGFDACVYGHEAEPSYFAFSTVMYRLAQCYHRACPSALKNCLFAFARKPTP